MAISLSVLFGCSDAATEPNGPLLLGEWGSERALLIALHSGAEVQLACAVVIVDEPIELQAGPRFTVQGRLQTSSAVIGELPRIRGTGEIRGSLVILSLPLGSGGSLATFQLDAGVRPAQGELPTCPQ
jgi:hypothetical protein